MRRMMLQSDLVEVAHLNRITGQTLHSLKVSCTQRKFEEVAADR